MDRTRSIIAAIVGKDSDQLMTSASSKQRPMVTRKVFRDQNVNSQVPIRRLSKNTNAINMEMRLKCLVLFVLKTFGTSKTWTITTNVLLEINPVLVI